MSNYFDPGQWGELPPGVSPMPNIGAVCVKCGEPTHIYETDLSIDDDGNMICGACTRRAAKRQRSADGRREITKQHKWKHGHDPADDEDSRDPNIVYINLEQVEAPKIERPIFSGGPETPFLCETCGTKLRAVASRTVRDVLKPLGYKGNIKEKIVALVCPNDKPDQRHKFMQMRESFLQEAMSRVPNI